VFFQRGVDGAWVVAGSARVGFERCHTLGFLASDQLLQPIAGDGEDLSDQISADTIVLNPLEGRRWTAARAMDDRAAEWMA
jgi:hypothetical protein